MKICLDLCNIRCKYVGYRNFLCELMKKRSLKYYKIFFHCNRLVKLCAIFNCKVDHVLNNVHPYSFAHLNMYVVICQKRKCCLYFNFKIITCIKQYKNWKQKVKSFSYSFSFHHTSKFLKGIKICATLFFFSFEIFLSNLLSIINMIFFLKIIKNTIF